MKILFIAVILMFQMMVFNQVSLGDIYLFYDNRLISSMLFFKSEFIWIKESKCMLRYYFLVKPFRILTSKLCICLDLMC